MLSDRQQQIIEASMELIDKKGIQGFTIKNLSKELGISEPGIYRHFESKFDIMNTILDVFKDQLYDYQNMLSSKDTRPEERIIEFFDSLFRVLTANPTFASVIFAEEIFRNEKRLSEKIFEIQGINTGMMKELIMEARSGSKTNPDIDPDMINMILHGSVRFIVRQWKAGKHNFNLRSKGNELVSAIIKAMI
ncbi:MAG: TetR/AcrR family transcriptional regulator [Bacteroidales bacterium]|nr:TetR/AcrR family transcriptional regulator [Bacteroidales bacterium]